jgi:hypothetical protein
MVVRLSSGQSPREANVGNLKIGTLHNYLQKGGANLVGWNNLRKIAIEHLQNVKKIF